jgi:hypothetical protein
VNKTFGVTLVHPLPLGPEMTTQLTNYSVPYRFDSSNVSISFPTYDIDPVDTYKLVDLHFFDAAQKDMVNEGLIVYNMTA